jgi:Cytochrome c554 and c-prime
MSQIFLQIASRSILISFAYCLLFAALLSSQSASQRGISITTADRLRTPGFWPTKGDANREDYTGTAECAKCHTEIVKTQATTPMAQASFRVTDSPILRQHPVLSFRSGPYEYQIVSSNTEVQYAVTNDTKSISAPPLTWAFGLGNKGQTFLYTQNGSLHESRLSFYKSLGPLDVTTGNLRAESYSLEGSLGRLMDTAEARRCFGCHTSESTTNNQFAPEHALPGVVCESCHGPGRKHVAAMKAGQIEAGRKAIFNPRHLNPVDSVDFCGACHRT